MLELVMVSSDYHEQVVEQEDFSLVDAAPLTSVWIRNLKQLTAAHQPAVRHGEHLPPPHTHTQSQSPVKVPHDGASAQRDVSQAFCRQPSSPRPGPGRRGHRWSSAPISGSFHRWPPEGLWGCPGRYQPLLEAHRLLVRVWTFNASTASRVVWLLGSCF